MDHLIPARLRGNQCLQVLLFIYVFLSFVLPSHVMADQAENKNSVYSLSLEDLGKLKVESASKQLEPGILAPGSVYVIRRDEMDRFGFRSLQDALKIVPSVYLYDPHSWIWGGQRGLVSNFSQTLVLVNGREVNNLVAGEGFISRQFSTSNIKRIEVVAGPSSALYGANALAGVINIISREMDPAYSGYNVDAEIGSFNRWAAGITFGQQISEKTRLSGNFRYFTSGEQDYTGFAGNQEDFLRGWADAPLAAPLINDYRNPSRSATWEVQLDHGDFYAGTYGYYNVQSHGLEKLSWSYTNNRDYRRFELYYGGFNGKVTDTLKVKAEYQYIRSFFWGKYFQGLWPDARLETADGVDLFTFPAQVTTSTGAVLNGIDDYKNYYPSFAHYLIDQNLLDPTTINQNDIERYFTHLYSNKSSDGSSRQRVDLQLGWTPGDLSSVIAGFSFDYIDYAGLATTDGATGSGAGFDIRLDSTKRQDVYDSEKYGVFAQYKREFPGRNIWLTAGLRVDNQNHYGTSVNPRVSLIWQPVPGSILEAAYSQAYREPNVFELSSDPGIDPAKMEAWEISLNQVIADHATLQITFYQNEVSDFLNSVSSLIGAGISSVDSQTIRGLEYQLEGGFFQWRYFFNGAQIITADQKAFDNMGMITTHDVLGIPGSRFNLGIARYFGEWSVSILFRYQGSYRALSGNTNISDQVRIPSTRELDLVVNSPEINLGGGGWRASLMVNNLTDARNYDANIRRSGPNRFLQDGRNIVFSINAGF